LRARFDVTVDVMKFVRACSAALALTFGSVCAAAAPNPAEDAVVLDARTAWSKRDKPRLEAARATIMAVPAEARHPLAPWVEYWELNNRLAEATTDELEAFYARWKGMYVEDRLRNDWLLELGRRRDWAAFAHDFPRFRMNDDREVTCYALLTEHLAGRHVEDAARTAWLTQRDADDGCALLAQTLFDARVFDADDVWRKLRLATEYGRTRTAQKAAELLGTGVAAAVTEVHRDPARYLARKATAGGRGNAELTALAIGRMAHNDPETAAGHLERRWQRALPADLAAWAWSQAAKQAALKLLPDAPSWFRRAEGLSRRHAAHWTDDLRGWQARAALRSGDWPQVLDAIDAMSAAEQREPAWVYWKARALKATAADGSDGAERRARGHALLMQLSGPLHYYAKLAAEDLGEPHTLPPAPEPLQAVERANAAKHPGLDRALMLIALGLRDEGVREWNFALRGMNDRSLLAAAELACEREVWDRCINTSDRTKGEIDIAQRYPMPYRAELTSRARELGLDPAYVFGLIRQESRFVLDARSGVGASGLMQIMPATARWTAKRIGLRYTPDMITDRDVNLKLGTQYLKLVLDDFGGSLPMAAAAYNAGPSRPRRWREGPPLEAAVWAENIPFSETRDYVKKVLNGATDYAALLGDKAPSLKARLGPAIGPRETIAPAPDEELP
jgi:soluble lytic murein transglycosylase